MVGNGKGGMIICVVVFVCCVDDVGVLFWYF